ncbi:MAG TPA: hypothetical protein VK183_04145, partial [Flavobacterium sp.]|nr:hypothetical protein [Flavobacterium sp.]
INIMKHFSFYIGIDVSKLWLDIAVLDPALVISRQMFIDSNIAVESFFGIGIAQVRRERFEEVYNDETGEFDIEELLTTKAVPNFQLGFRIGLGD